MITWNVVMLDMKGYIRRMAAEAIPGTALPGMRDEIYA